MRILSNNLRLCQGIVCFCLIAVTTDAIAQPEPDVGTAIAPREKKKGARGNPLSVPDTDNVRQLLRFVQQLGALVPSPNDDPDAFLRRVNSAARRACEKIRQVEKDETSDAYRFATQRLIELELESLADAPPNRTREIADRASGLLDKAGLDAAAAALASELAAIVEERGENEMAKRLNQSFGERFAKSPDVDAVKLGRRMAGAARRLGVIGQPIEITGRTLDGRDFDIAKLRGKVVLVDFWTTWCGFCLEEFPNIKRNYQLYREKGFEVVGVNCDEDADAVKQFFRTNHLPWPTLRDDKLGADHPAAERYGVSSFPTTFLVDAQGKVIATDVRGRDLRTHLRKLLGSPTEAAPMSFRFPIFNSVAVMERLAEEGEKLVVSKKARDLATLRAGMERKSHAVKLPAPAKTAISDVELYRAALDSIFILGGIYKLDDSDGWEVALGTAFVVAEDGVLTTSCHVFDDDLDIRAMVAMNAKGQVYAVEEILAANQLLDTCLFRVAARDLRPLPMTENPAPGSRVRVVSHPGDSYYFFSDGKVANYQSDDDHVAWMNITADFGQGSSGAPVFDDFGNVVGQVSRTSTLFAEGAELPTTRGARRVWDSQKFATSNQSRPRRTNDSQEKKSTPDDERAATLYADPQMVFKMCVPVETILKLVK